MFVYGDIESFSQCNLQDKGAFNYANDHTTGIFFLCWVTDNDPEVHVYRPGDSVPGPFAEPTRHWFVWDNWDFDRTIHARILVERYGFPPIPIERQDCAQRRALASGYPAELGLRCEALGLPYRKDPEARAAMLRLSRPQTQKERKAPADPAARQRDLEKLLERGMSDVLATRASYNSPRLRSLLPDERHLLLLDAKINARGIAANVDFLKAACTLATQERDATNTRLNEISAGVITSVDQTRRIMQAVNACGHGLTSLNKRSVAATLAHQPEGFARELLELRKQGAYASTRKFKKLLDFADPNDHRIRGALRIYGSHTWRWTSPGPQLHNLPRNDTGLPASLVGALIAGKRDELARWGNPLEVVSGMSRAALRADPGNELISPDYSAVEPRILAWLSGETWKLDAFRQYDATGDERLHPYRQIAARMLNKSIDAITPVERQKGKGAELGCGFGGGVGALRRIVGDSERSDAELQADVDLWRAAHPATRAFWHDLARAARVAIRIGQNQPVLVAPPPRPPIVAAFDGYALTLTLPSGRPINYPGARLVPNTKFENGDPDIEYLTNTQKQWRPVRAWFGVLIENVVQACARDLLAAAIIRAEARGWNVVLHCHDELVIEAPEGNLSDVDVLALLLERPPWAEGLPLGGKMHRGRLYLDAPATAEPPPLPESEPDIVERAVDAFIAVTPPNPAIARAADEDFLAGLSDTIAPLTHFVTLPMNGSGRVSCPFHDDPEPSCKIYGDHWHCYGCGARGDRLDWLTRVEGLTRPEAVAALQDWCGPASTAQRQDIAERVAFALALWNAAGPLASSLGERYLADTRGVDTTKLPSTIHDVLRFHPSCPFGARARHPCIVALMRDPVTNTPVGIHRIGLTVENGAVVKLDRMALGRMGVLKLWPAKDSGRLVIGEGLETVLAAATQIPYLGAPLTPAWSAVARGGLGTLPVLPDIKRLILLVDNDANGEGQKAAARCRDKWTAAGRAVVPLIPKTVGWDFNDIVLAGRKE